MSEIDETDNKLFGLMDWLQNGDYRIQSALLVLLLIIVGGIYDFGVATRAEAELQTSLEQGVGNFYRQNMPTPDPAEFIRAHLATNYQRADNGKYHVNEQTRGNRIEFSVVQEFNTTLLKYLGIATLNISASRYSYIMHQPVAAFPAKRDRNTMRTAEEMEFYLQMRPVPHSSQVDMGRLMNADQLEIDQYINSLPANERMRTRMAIEADRKANDVLDDNKP